MVATYGIHWFRQDLRLQENPSLLSLSKKVDQIIPIYIFDLNQRIGSTSKWWLEKSLFSYSKDKKITDDSSSKPSNHDE